ncbi:MAG TPA: acyl carrier protein [Pyrinomonadaceae bacterium]
MTQTTLNENQLAAKQLLAELCRNNLNHDELTGEMKLFEDLGVDSLQFIRLILEVETRVGRKIFDVETIASLKTVNDLYGLLETV